MKFKYKKIIKDSFISILWSLGFTFAGIIIMYYCSQHYDELRFPWILLLAIVIAIIGGLFNTACLLYEDSNFLKLVIDNLKSETKLLDANAIDFDFYEKAILKVINYLHINTLSIIINFINTIVFGRFIIIKFGMIFPVYIVLSCIQIIVAFLIGASLSLFKTISKYLKEIKIITNSKKGVK